MLLYVLFVLKIWIYLVLKDVNVFLFIFLGVIDKNGFYKSKDLNIIIYFFFYLDGML